MADKKSKSESNKYRDDIAQEAISIVEKERRQWEDAVCYITESVGFRMRQMIRTLRRNYWGVFEEPVDPTTSRDKIWIQLVQSICEDYVKNIDVDQKDLNFRARKPEGSQITELTRFTVKNYLDQIYFGETLDESERQLAIDGTVVWKTWESKEGGKVKLNRRTVDLLHCYIDPTEDSIQTAYRFTERALLLPDQMRGYKGWKDVDGIKGSTNLDRNDTWMKSTSSTGTTGSFSDVWEMWGKIPRWMVTGDQKAEDAYEEIDGHIVVSGLEARDPRCHLVEENKKKDKFGNVLKPYEEVRAAKITGRWYGLGPAERILALQEYLNTVINARQNRARVSQLGLFKYRKGSGITSQLLQNLATNAAIPVNQMDDIEQMPVQDVSPSSYKDEEVIINWAQKITSAYPVVAGEMLPSSTPATNAVIQEKSARSSFVMVQNAIGSFLERWLDRHALPIIAKTISLGDMVRISGDDEKFNKLVTSIVASQMNKELEEANDSGASLPVWALTEQSLKMEYDRRVEQMRNQPDLFVEVVQEVIADNVDTNVYVTNEEMNVAVVVQNLQALLGLYPEAKEQISRQIFDLMGLEFPQLPPPQMQPQATQPEQALSMVSATEEANTPV